MRDRACGPFQLPASHSSSVTAKNGSRQIPYSWRPRRGLTFRRPHGNHLHVLGHLHLSACAPCSSHFGAETPLLAPLVQSDSQLSPLASESAAISARPSGHLALSSHSTQLASTRLDSPGNWPGLSQSAPNCILALPRLSCINHEAPLAQLEAKKGNERRLSSAARKSLASYLQVTRGKLRGRTPIARPPDDEGPRASRQPDTRLHLAQGFRSRLLANCWAQSAFGSSRGPSRVAREARVGVFSSSKQARTCFAQGR